MPSGTYFTNLPLGNRIKAIHPIPYTHSHSHWTVNTPTSSVQFNNKLNYCWIFWRSKWLESIYLHLTECWALSAEYKPELELEQEKDWKLENPLATKLFSMYKISPRATVHNSHYKFIFMKYEVDTLHIDEREQGFIIAIFHGLAQTLPASLSHNEWILDGIHWSIWEEHIMWTLP